MINNYYIAPSQQMPTFQNVSYLCSQNSMFVSPMLCGQYQYTPVFPNANLVSNNQYQNKQYQYQQQSQFQYKQQQQQQQCSNEYFSQQQNSPSLSFQTSLGEEFNYFNELKSSEEHLHNCELKEFHMQEKSKLYNNENQENCNYCQSTDQSSFYSEKCNENEINCLPVLKKISKVNKKVVVASYSYKKRNCRNIELIQSVGKCLSSEEAQIKPTETDLIILKKESNQAYIINDKIKANLSQIKPSSTSTNKSHQLLQKESIPTIESFQNCILNQNQTEQQLNAASQSLSESDSKLHFNKELNQAPVICYENLKKQMRQLYGEEDDLALISLIDQDLEKQQKTITDKSFVQQDQQQVSNNNKNSGEQIDKQQLLFLKCAFLTVSSNIHQQFTKYSQGVLQQSPYHLTNSNNNNITLTSCSNEQQNKINKPDHSQEEMQIERQEPFKQIPNQSYQNNSSSETITKKGVDQTTFGLKNTNENKFFFNLQPKSKEFLRNFDFSDVRQNQVKNQKKMREKKPNSSYIKNSQYHNLNKLFMYNILSMFRIDSLNNLNIPQQIISELTNVIQELKLSSRRDYQNPSRGFFDYFSHSHYKVLFLKINSQNIQHIRDSAQEVELHKRCFGIDLSNDVSEIDFTYINLIKEICFNIFIVNIRENELFDDGSSSKQNVRRKYTQKVINGIKKLAHGVPIKRF